MEEHECLKEAIFDNENIKEILIRRNINGETFEVNIITYDDNVMTTYYIPQTQKSLLQNSSIISLTSKDKLIKKEEEKKFFNRSCNLNIQFEGDVLANNDDHYFYITQTLIKGSEQ